MAESSKVKRMSDFTNNVLHVGPEQAISDLQKFLKENPGFNKVFLIAVDNSVGEFEYTWFRGKMLCSEASMALRLSDADMVDQLR